jgi:integrase
VDGDFSATIALDERELNDVVEAARALDPVLYLAVLLLATTGIRAKELLSAQRSDFTIDHGHPVIFVTRKGGKRARVTVPPKVAHILDRELNGRADGFLLRAEQVPYWWLYRKCVQAGQAAGLGVPDTPKAARRVTPHVLRATFATLYLSSPTANLAWLQDAMGHADSRTTRGYDRGAGQLDRLSAVTNLVASHLHLREDT